MILELLYITCAEQQYDFRVLVFLGMEQHYDSRALVYESYEGLELKTVSAIV